MKHIPAFQKRVWRFYQQHQRDLPWRRTNLPYRIWISEVMLQQTQVSRVIPKYAEFLRVFPNVKALARAHLREVLRVWSGLGYNRRAVLLHRAAKIIVQERSGKLPSTQGEWSQLPGVGTNTAGAIMAYAYNKPVVFIETNIRAVFLHELFAGRKNVSDAEIEAVVAKRIREWYWALMDYGSYIKRQYGNPNERSAHYAKQSKFQGSIRQLRGHVVRLLIAAPATAAQISTKCGAPRARVQGVLNGLLKDGLISKNGQRYAIE